jgi:hypothetical protein
MNALDKDEDFEAVKKCASEIGPDILRLTDVEFVSLYGATKIEVSINTKVMEALSNAGNITNLMPIYFWFQRLLVKAAGIKDDDEMLQVPKP